MKKKINLRTENVRERYGKWITTAAFVLTFIFWIAPISNLAQEPVFCWRDSYGRGVGTIPSDCAEGQQKLGLLCYTNCPAGMKRAGVDCHSICPDGMRDDGLFCRQAEYGRGAGYVIWDRGKCEKDNPQGCEKNGALWYPKCKPGYSAFGCCICRPQKPDCAARGLNSGIDLSCGKKIQLGDVHTASCPPGKEYNAGLCYEKCKPGYKGVGPVCWGQPPPGWSECGMGAAKDSKKCASIIFGQVAAVAGLAINVATLGSAMAAKFGTKTAQNAEKVGKLAELKAQFEKMKEAFEKLRRENKAVEGAIQTFDAANKGYKGYVATDTALNKVVTEEDMVRLAAQIAAIVDPSGISDTVAAFTYPKCSKYGFSPDGGTLVTTVVNNGQSNNGSNGWTKIDGSATDISVNANGNAWLVNNAGSIFEFNGSNWMDRPGRAKDIGVGADGSVWVIGNVAEAGGFGIYRWNGSDWNKIPGGAVRVAVAPSGNAWVVNDVGSIFEYNGSGWTDRPGKAKDIGVGANGKVWVIGTDQQVGGFGIHHWDGSNWNNVPGGAVRIAVGPTGNAWVVNDVGSIFEYNGSGWTDRPGKAKDIGVGANGKVWIIGDNEEAGGFGIYRMN